MLSEWCRAGFSPLEFWLVTPAEHHAAVSGHIERMRDDAEFAQSNNWWVAYLTRTSKFPALDDYVNSRHKRKIIHDPDEGLAALASHQRSLNKGSSR